jgi:alkylation response protein AidB-like acyl-CoA dehydrogenase
MTSEPGSGGDILKTRTRAEEGSAGTYLLSGEKHFGSGSGISSYMITTARVDGADQPNIFFMDVRGRHWNGSDGLTMTAEWDGHGMCATQSHAFRLNGMPATPMAWPGAAVKAGPVTNQLAACLFTAVVLSIVEGAVEMATQKLSPRKNEMRSFERVGWSEIVNQAWTMRQVLNGMIAAVESGNNGEAAAARGKAVVADSAESCMAQLGRVVGGGAFSRSAPYGQWAQDVRALGFLRPPWGLAFDQLFDMAWQ